MLKHRKLRFLIVDRLCHLCKSEQFIQIQCLFQSHCQTLKLFFQCFDLSWQNQTQVTAFQIQIRKLRHITEHLHSQFLLDQWLQLSIDHRGHLIKNHSPDLRIFPKA